MTTKPTSGFTLVELLISVGLMGILSAGIYKYIRTSAVTTSELTETSQHLRGSQQAIVLMRADISQAGFDPRYTDLGRAAANPVTLAASDRLTIQGDFNMNGNFEGSGVTPPESIAFVYSAATKRVTRNGSPFLIDVDDFSFLYFDASGNSDSAVPGAHVTALSRIRRIQVQWKQNTSSRVDKEQIAINLRNYR